MKVKDLIKHCNDKKTICSRCIYSNECDRCISELGFSPYLAEFEDYEKYQEDEI